MKRLHPLCAWVLFMACQTPSEPAAPVPSPASPQVDLAAERAALRRRRLPRTAACQGLASDAQVSESSVVNVPEKGTCKLVYPSGAVVVIHGPAEALVAPDAQSALVLGVGLAEVDLPAGALTPESGFWLALPGAALALVESGRLVVRTFPAGPSQLAVVSGRATLRGEGDAHTLRAGQAATLAASGATTPIKDAPLTVRAALDWARALATPSGGDREASAAQADAAFRAAEAQFGVAKQALQALERSHAEAVKQGDREAVRRLQTEVATQSGAMLALRRTWHARAASSLALRLPLDHAAHARALAALGEGE